MTINHKSDCALMNEPYYMFDTVCTCGAPSIPLEIAYTTWHDSCKAPYPPDRECRRERGHEPPHASGHTENGTYQEWE